MFPLLYVEMSLHEVMDYAINFDNPFSQSTENFACVVQRLLYTFGSKF